MSASDAVPSSMGLRRVPAAEASLQLEHVEGCLCRHHCLATISQYPDVNMIDARCIAAYLVPRG